MHFLKKADFFTFNFGQQLAELGPCRSITYRLSPCSNLREILILAFFNNFWLQLVNNNVLKSWRVQFVTAGYHSCFDTSTGLGEEEIHTYIYIHIILESLKYSQYCCLIYERPTDLTVEVQTITDMNGSVVTLNVCIMHV